MERTEQQIKQEMKGLIRDLVPANSNKTPIGNRILLVIAIILIIAFFSPKDSTYSGNISIGNTINNIQYIQSDEVRDPEPIKKNKNS